MTMKLSIAIGIATALTLVFAPACKDKDKTATPTKTTETEVSAPVGASAPPAPRPVEPPASSGSAAPATGTIDTAQLTGKWTSIENPDVIFTFNADGTSHNKTPVSEYPGTFELKGDALTMHAKDTQTKDYVVLEVSANKLRLKDVKYSVVTEFKR